MKKGSCRKGIKRDLLTYNHNSVLNRGQFSEAVEEGGRRIALFVLQIVVLYGVANDTSEASEE